MRWSTSQLPESYFRRVNQKSWPALARAVAGSTEAASAAASRRRAPRRSTSPRPPPSDRVRERGEGEVAQAHRRDHHAEARFVAADPHRLAELVDVVEHDHRRLVEAEVLQRVLDLAVFD